MQYEKYDLEEVKKNCLMPYVESITSKSKHASKDQYICPLCGSGTGKSGTGAFTVYPDKNNWFCFVCKRGGSVIDLYIDKNNMNRDSKTDIAKARDELGAMFHLMPEVKPEIVSRRSHIYTNKVGNILAKKDITKYSDGSKRPYWSLYHPETGTFTNNLNGVAMPLYHADRLYSSQGTVYFVEGEKDVETLEKYYGLTATSTPNGGGQTTWIELYNEDLSGREIIVITDNDEAGKKYGHTVAVNLCKIAKSVKIIPTKAIWPGCPEKADISDAVEALGADETMNRLTAAIEKAEIYSPELNVPEPTPEEQKLEYTVKCLADVQPKPIKFVWYPYIPLGEITIMFAAGGTGKSFLTCGIAADITSGQRLPNPYEPSVTVPKQNVLIISAEDSESILQQRLAAAGADISRCFIIAPPDTQKELETYQPFELPCDAHDIKHINALKKAISDHNAKLIIIDPWAAYVGKDTDMNRANSVRAITAELTVIAKEMECAFLIVAHVNKKAQADNANDAVAGSADLVNGARSALAVRFFGDTDGRIMIHTKCNYEALGKSVCYQIINQGKGKVGKFEWNGFSEITKEDLENAARTGKKLKDIADDKHDEEENKKTAIKIITNLAVFGKKVNVTYTRFRELINKESDINFLSDKPTRFINSLISDLRPRGITLENVGKRIRDDFPDGTKGESPFTGFTICCMTDGHLMAEAMSK